LVKGKNAYIVAVAGATSARGRELIDLLDERKFPVGGLVALAPEQSAGERLEFKGRSIVARKITKEALKDADVAFFFDDVETSRQYAPLAVRSGAIAIDGSQAFQGDATVPLVVPEVNRHVLDRHTGIIANPCSASIGLAMVLKPILAQVRLKSVVVTTLQPASDTGKKAMDELAQQTVALLNFRDLERIVYPHQIAFNCFPQAGEFLEQGDTTEEADVVNDARRLLEDDKFQISATCVRVPVFRGFSESITIEAEMAISANELRAVLSGMPGVIVYDDPGRSLYPTPIEVVGKNEIHVGRIRENRALRNGITIWCVFDDLRKGTSLNAVQIAEELIHTVREGTGKPTDDQLA